MAQLNGKSPEELAADIMEQLTKPVNVEVSGAHADLLNVVLRYKHAKKIYSKGDKWFTANLENLRTEWLEQIIEAQHDQRVKQDKKQAEADQYEYVRVLVARGINRYKALEMAGLITAEDLEAQQKIEADAKAKATAQATPVKK